MSQPSQRLLDALQHRLGYQFSQPDLLVRALTHRSAHRDHNERLEFLGDALIGLVTAAAFYDRFPGEDEGVLSRLRASVVSGKSLASLAKELDLSSCLILGESERKSGGRLRDSILADTFEALAGAAMLDGSLPQARDVVGAWLEPAIAAATPDATVDAKTRLQEWCQARSEALPEYSVVEVTGSDHAQSFRVQCLLADQQRSTKATGSSRRRAEQSSAALMLDQILGG